MREAWAREKSTCQSLVLSLDSRGMGVLGKGEAGAKKFRKLMESGVSSGSQPEPSEMFDWRHDLFREGF